jgi:hypothetical protein
MIWTLLRRRSSSTPTGYISAHENASTAECFTRCGELLIRVTFWTAPPPHVSCFTVHCPTLPQESVPHAFGYLPMILSTVEDLVLLRFAISPDGGGDDEVRPDSDEYFVDQAAGDTKERRRPSLLHLILVPTFLEFSDREPVLLRGRGGMFFVAILCRRPSDRERFDVHLYNSETRKWCTKRMQSPQEEFHYSYSSKAITIGGELGSVGWVDLCGMASSSTTFSWTTTATVFVTSHCRRQSCPGGSATRCSLGTSSLSMGSSSYWT